MTTQSLNKIVLAYSGGLDTSVILKWLQEQYHCEVVTFTADIGQGEELAPAKLKAQAMGVKENLYRRLTRRVCLKTLYFPCSGVTPFMKVNTCLEPQLLDPLIAKRLVENCKRDPGQMLYHTVPTGKGR